FGTNVRPLAHVKVLSTPRECTTSDLQIDEFLLKHGAPLSLEATLNRYGRTLPKAGETIFLNSISSVSERNGIKASRSESSHNLGMAEGMGNNHWGGCGVAVNSRGRSPSSFNTSRSRGDETQTLEAHLQPVASADTAALDNRGAKFPLPVAGAARTEGQGEGERT